jgi:integrase
MPVDDLWYLSKRSPDDERLQSKRYGRGKRWRVRWIDDAGQPKQQLFERKADAERHDVNMRADVSRGVYIDPTAGKVTVKAYGELWRGQQLHAAATVDRIERSLRLHVYPDLGQVALSQLRQPQVQAWVKSLSTRLAPSSVKVTYGVLYALLTAAVLDRRIGISPCLNIRLPEVERAQYVIATPAQVHALAEHLVEPYSALVYIAAGCGLRLSEAFGLELAHIDFLRREVRVAQQMTTAGGRAPHLAPPKTVTSKRTVELGAVVGEALARHIELHPPKEVEVLDETDPRKPTVRMAKLLFPTSRGTPLSRSTWNYPWARAVKGTDLPPGYGYHDLRHYYATLLIHGGASVKTVQMALGHATPTITLNTYVGEWPEAVDRTRNLVDAALGQKAPLRVAR